MMKEKTAIRETQPAKSINAVNTVTIGDKMRSYLKNPASFIMMIFVMLAAFVTFAALLFIICYVLIKGVPNLTHRFSHGNTTRKTYRCSRPL